MLPQPSDDHWLLLSLGLAAMFIQVGFSFVCAAFFLFPPSAPVDPAGPGIGSIAAFFGLAFTLNIIQIFLHEMGHALAAWSVNRRVHMICVGIVGYAPDIKKFMRIVKPANAEYAGFVQASPTWPDLDHSKSIWISAGGPLATGMTGLLILFVSAMTGSLSSPFLSLAAFFVMDAVVNLIPLRWSRGGGSDGLHILQYWRGAGWTADMWAETRLAMAEYSPNLVSDSEWQELKSVRNAPFNSIVFNKLLDRAARQRLE